MRDRGALEPARARPFQGFGDQDVYPEPLQKAAALLELLAINHPFVDGNKRIALVLALYLLEELGFQLTADHEARYQLVIDVANGKLRFEVIVAWLHEHTAPV